MRNLEYIYKYIYIYYIYKHDCNRGTVWRLRRRRRGEGNVYEDGTKKLTESIIK
jgi:hypothetical protein